MKYALALGLAMWSCIAMAAQPPAEAGVIRGRLAYPSEEIPPLTVVARGLDGQGDYTTKTRRNQTGYRIAVPPGRYIVFAIPDGMEDPLLRGAYTAYSQCNDIIRRGGTSLKPCKSGSPLTVTVAAGKTSANVHIDDWYLEPDVASALQLMPQTGPTSPR